MAFDNPLSPDDLTDIDANLAQLEDAKELIRRSKQAGIDVTTFEQQVIESRNQLLKLKQSFFPGQ